MEHIITTKEQLDEMVAYYLKQDAFAYDCETVGDKRVIPAVNEVLWLSFSTHGRGDVIPLGHPHGEFESETFPLTPQGEKRVLAGLPIRESDYSKDRKKAIKSFGSAPTQLFPAEVFEALKPLFFNENILTIGQKYLPALILTPLWRLFFMIIKTRESLALMIAFKENLAFLWKKALAIWLRFMVLMRLLSTHSLMPSTHLCFGKF